MTPSIYVPASIYGNIKPSSFLFCVVKFSDRYYPQCLSLDSLRLSLMQIWNIDKMQFWIY